jgi:hypothetical protein
VEGGIKMIGEKKTVNNRSALFVPNESEMHYVQVEPDSDEYLKVWIKQPTWLQVEQAMTSVLKVDAKTQSVDLDLNAMYRYMTENFIEKTEPSLSAIDLLRLTPFVGNQIKDILPNPFEDIQGDEVKNEESEML